MGDPPIVAHPELRLHPDKSRLVRKAPCLHHVEGIPQEAVRRPESKRPVNPW